MALLFSGLNYFVTYILNKIHRRCLDNMKFHRLSILMLWLMSQSDIYCAKLIMAKYSYITKQLHPQRFPCRNHRVQTRRSSLRRRYWMKTNFTGRSHLLACFRSYLASGNLFIPIPNSWAENYEASRAGIHLIGDVRRVRGRIGTGGCELFSSISGRVSWAINVVATVARCAC
jgi:hypothetical protein